jgi:glutamine---fructose-6-phosphate transaminase (isomerizing)
MGRLGINQVRSSSGAQVFSEILDQPQCWIECFKTLREQGALAKIRQKFPGGREWVFTGCGSSYYIAQVAAASWTLATGGRARALPASEILLFPELALAGSTPIQPVLISRSGRTSETLRAGEFLQAKHQVAVLGAVCEPDSPLERMAAATLALPAADDQSMVVTRAFTSTLLALQAVAATYADHSDVEPMIHVLAEHIIRHLRTLPAQVEEFVGAHDLRNFVFLGQGLYYGVAQEAMLKVMEMSCSYAEPFHTLEFRHGPKAILSPETLVTFFLSESGYQAERAVLEEVKKLGAMTLAVANRADEATRRATDFLIELRLDVPEFYRPAAAIIPAQLLAYNLAKKKGMDADWPPHLSRVVNLTADS